MRDLFVYVTSYGREMFTNSLPSLFAGKCKSKARLDNKVAVITGCNSGLGKITALEFCKRGARVIMACRSLERAKHAADDIRKQLASFENCGELVLRELNLASFKSIRKCAEEILASEECIHILVNNAGGMCSRELTEDGHEMQFGAYHLGHFLFTLLLLPKIVNSAPARIINISSIIHTFAGGEMKYDDITLEQSYHPLSAYARNKLANILFAKELADKLKGTGVTTYSVHPGLVDTNFFKNSNNTTPMFRKFIESYIVRIVCKKSPEQGAQTILHCAIDEKAGRESGLYYSDCKPVSPDKAARSKEMAKALWDYSWSAVGFPQDLNSKPFIQNNSDQQPTPKMTAAVGGELITT